MRQIEKEAYVWANREIMTFEQAEEYIRARARMREAAEEVKRALGISAGLHADGAEIRRELALARFRPGGAGAGI